MEIQSRWGWVNVEQSASKDGIALPTWLTRVEFLATMGTVLVGLCLYENHLFFDDDAYITLRYARHVLAGLGPVWNASGPRVEGFTSPLHLILVCLLGAMHVPLPDAARAVGFASHLALLGFVAAYLKRRTNQLGACLGVLIVAASWMLLVWDLGGLDEVLYTAFTAAGALAGTGYFANEEPGNRRSLLIGSAFLAVATLARPEGAMLLGGLWLFATMDFRKDNLRERLVSIAYAAALAAAVLLPLVAFRWFYYHQWAPNTFYAKIGGIGQQELIRWGQIYFLAFLKTPPFLVQMAFISGVYALAKGKFRAPDAALWGMMGLVVLFVVMSGGDHMTDFRFCLPLIPLLTVALIQNLYRTGLLGSQAFCRTFIPFLVFLLALQARSDPLNPVVLDRAAWLGEDVGRYIHDYWRPGSLVALNTAGSTPYYADDMNYIDMLGLNDAEIARRKNIPEFGPWIHLVGHLKGDGASVLSRRPDYIILGPTDGTTPEKRRWAYFIGDYEIGLTPSFERDYGACVVLLPDGVPFTYFQRRDLHSSCARSPHPNPA